MSSSELTILKLGGSVITEKDRPETLDGDALRRAASAIADAATDRLVVVHGGGSFGHHHATEHGVSTTVGTDDPAAVLDIHGAMTTLNQFVLRRLREHDVASVPVHPLSGAVRSGDELHVQTETVRGMLDTGFVPVLHGDVIVDQERGATILSGDELVVRLAETLDADRVGLCSAVPGVLNEADAVIDRIVAYEDVEHVLGGSDATDVSGGMAGKVQTLLDSEATASIFDLDAIGAFLAGDSPGTTIE